MSRTVLLCLLALGAVVAGLAMQDEPGDFDWVAPNPPLPNTQHYFTGWDGSDMYATNPPLPDPPLDP